MPVWQFLHVTAEYAKWLNTCNGRTPAAARRSRCYVVGLSCRRCNSWPYKTKVRNIIFITSWSCPFIRLVYILLSLAIVCLFKSRACQRSQQPAGFALHSINDWPARTASGVTAIIACITVPMQTRDTAVHHDERQSTLISRTGSGHEACQ